MEEKAQNKIKIKKEKKVQKPVPRRKKKIKHLFKLFINIKGDFNQIDFDIFENTPTLKKKLLDIALSEILDAVGTKKDHVEICEINDSGHVVCIHKSQWPVILEKIKKSYIEEERYEDCVHIQKLIDSYER